MNKFITADDVTHNRCTVIGLYASRCAADVAAETDDEMQVFEIADDSDEIKPAMRVHHAGGKAWRR